MCYNPSYVTQQKRLTHAAAHHDEVVLVYQIYIQNKRTLVSMLTYHISSTDLVYYSIIL